MLSVLYFTCILFVFFAVTVCECHIEIKGYLLMWSIWPWPWRSLWKIM